MQEALQEVLEGEMTEFLGAAPGERTEGRTGYRAGYYSRSLITRVGKLELRVPRDRNGEFSTASFERYTRSEKALVAALAEMYVQGVSTRKVKAITEELCGHSFSASTIRETLKKSASGRKRKVHAAAATGTYQVDRRGSENEVSAQANIGEADVKAVIAAGRSQHHALLRFARAAIYSAFPLEMIGERAADWFHDGCAANVRRTEPCLGRSGMRRGGQT
jgi:hypothetical protein